MDKKLKVVVLFGGLSTEHEVSRLSAYSVLTNIDKNIYEVIMVGLTKNGDWLPYEGSIEKLKDGSWETESRVIYGENTGLCPGLELIRKADVVFPVLHGMYGEDGTVQGLLELMGIPYVGCNVLAAAVGMDKAYSKIVFEKVGIPQCKHLVVHRNELEKNAQVIMDQIEMELGYPCFVKPSNSGSSVGVHKVKDREDLYNSLKDASEFDRKVIVEEFINGREIECAVLGNFEPEASLAGEIIPSKEFYDYEDKYLSGNSITEIPAMLPIDVMECVRKLAKQAFLALDCSGLSRVDFFYEKSTGRLLLNEINTMPGFTEISMYAKLWAAMGVDYSKLVTKLIELAFERKQENSRKV